MTMSDDHSLPEKREARHSRSIRTPNFGNLAEIFVRLGKFTIGARATDGRLAMCLAWALGAVIGFLALLLTSVFFVGYYCLSG